MEKLVRILMLVMLILTLAMSAAFAAAKGKIVFIPHDNRPISKAETAEVVEKLGYEVVMPPDEILSNGKDRYGKTEKLWAWTKENIHGADAAVISTDTMIYGGLVPSRNHSFSEEELAARAENFRELRRANPNLKIYGFGSLMRTPRSGIYAGAEEPPYYFASGADIFTATALMDKQETIGLTAKEEIKLNEHRDKVAAANWEDWLGRRGKNINVSKKLIDFTREGVFSYFVIGKDDNAPYSQTHREGRLLEKYSVALPETKFQLLAGIDEFGMLLLARAVNDREQQMPFIFVKYAPGTGADTVPSYSDTKIGDTIRSSILTAGGLMINNPVKADFYLVVNTNKDGKTGEANFANNGLNRKNTKAVSNLVNEAVQNGYRVGVADIAFANGADNALMNSLRDRGLLYKISAYAGWNTPTNSTGFVVGTGLLANRLKPKAQDDLLTRRYLEDWGYQANVRTTVGNEIFKFRQANVYSNIGEYEKGIVYRINQKIREFAASNLPPFNELVRLKVRLPWHRMFEAEFKY